LFVFVRYRCKNFAHELEVMLARECDSCTLPCPPPPPQPAQMPRDRDAAGKRQDWGGMTSLDLYYLIFTTNRIVPQDAKGPGKQKELEVFFFVNNQSHRAAGTSKSARTNSWSTSRPGSPRRRAKSRTSPQREQRCRRRLPSSSAALPSSRYVAWRGPRNQLV
jgi:hypothetical protein